MNAEEILARVAATYAAAAEYADTGEMTFNGVRKGEFRTSFVRASRRLVFEGVIGTTDDLVELVLTGTMPRRLVVDTKTWLITAHDFDATDQTRSLSRRAAKGCAHLRPFVCSSS